jgi:hypothetical protein
MRAPLGLRPCPAPLIHARDAREAGLHLELRDTAMRVRKGVYTSRARWQELAEWDKYLLRVHAVALTRPAVAFSHESAAALWGLPLFGHPRDIHIFDPRRERSVRYGDISVHTSEDPRSFHVDDDEQRVTTVPDTTLDLMRCFPPSFALAVADAALRLFPAEVSTSLLRTRGHDQRNIRGRARLHWALDRADRRAESVGESVSRAVIEWWGFPAPELQRTHVVEGRTFRSDFSWEDVRVIGESDGWSKYGTGAPDVRRAVRAEKGRENALRRTGWEVARWDYADVIAGTGLRDALIAAGLPQVRKPQPARLLTVARNPRSLAAAPPPR